MTKIHGIFLMIFSAIVVSFSGLLFRNIQDMEVFEIVFIRSFALVFVIIGILFFQYKTNILKKVISIGYPGLFASLSIGIAMTTYLISFTHTTIANTTFTLCATPFITSLLAYFFLREKISFYNFCMMLLATFGIYIMFTGGLQTGEILGNIFALLTCLFFGIFTVILRANKHIDMLPTLLINGLLMMLIGGVYTSFEIKFSTSDIIYCFIWGGVLHGIAQPLVVLATRLIKASEITIIQLIEFSFGPVWVWLLFKEVPNEYTLIGGAIVFSAVIMLTFNEIRKTYSNPNLEDRNKKSSKFQRYYDSNENYNLSFKNHLVIKHLTDIEKKMHELKFYYHKKKISKLFYINETKFFYGLANSIMSNLNKNEKNDK